MMVGGDGVVLSDIFIARNNWTFGGLWVRLIFTFRLSGFALAGFAVTSGFGGLVCLMISLVL
jgi:hypothetical protein